MYNLPSGTVTFLFTDIEGSTNLAQSLGNKWESLRARHNDILKSAIESNNGYVFQIIGDAFCATFHTAGDAVHAAAKAQIDLFNEKWGDAPVKVRMGINTGTAQASIDTDHSGGYKGYTAMARTQRLMSVGHGGQVLISLATEELAREELPDYASLRDIGEYRLKDLIRPERIHQLVISDLPSDFPLLNTLDAYRHNLPVQLTSFIGREKEMADITQILKENRLVTLTGIGGTGKTRLSLQVSADLIDMFSDGVWFVQLAPLSDESLVSQEVASVLGLQNQSGRSLPNMLADYVQKKELLLVLDNCEHVVEACATLANDLLLAGSGIKILATSRVSLNVQGEMTFPVHPLALPNPEQFFTLSALTQYEAVRLFIERAISVRPTFNVDNANAPAVAQICQRLDGIPLAIELAASRIRALSPDQIAKRLENCFDLLTGGARTALPRQQTLRATMNWSYELLTDHERDLLNQLSVFAGDFSLEAVESICVISKGSITNILDLLTALVDNSIVNISEETSETRYKLLETVRQYALEKLAESGKGDFFLSRHLDYFLKLAETAETHIVSFEQIHWLTKLDAEHENLRATLKYSLSNGNDTKSGMKLAKTLTEYWNMRSYFDEQLYWQKTALDKSESHRETPLRAKLLYDYGLINNTIRRKGKESQPMFEESLRIFKGLGEEYLSDYAYVLLWLGYQKYWEGHDTGKSKMREAIQIFEELDEKRGHGWALNLMAMLLLNEGKHHSALEAAKKGAALYKDCGDRFGYAICVDDLGTISLIQGNYTDAIKYYEETKGIYKEFRDKGFACQTIHGLGEAYRGLDEYEIAETYYRESLIMREEAGMASSWFVAVYQSLAYSVLRQGKKQQATSYFKEALELSRELSYKSSIIHCLAGFAAVAILQGKGNESALLFGAVDAQFQSLIAEGMKPDSLIEPVDRKEFEHYQTLCRAQLGKDDFESAMEEGKTMNLEEAIAFVTEKFNE